MKVNIAYASDAKYFRYMEVSALSAMMNKRRESVLVFHVFCDRVADSSREEFSHLCEGYGCAAHFYDLDIASVCDLPDAGQHISNVTYFRLLMAEVLKDLEKVIYLDCDTVVCDDLAKLHERDLGNYVLGGVEDLGYVELRRVLPDEYPISGFYINAGVLLVNLKIWREENLGRRAIDFARLHLGQIKIGDQDVINLFFQGRILAIAPTNNVQDSFFRFSLERNCWYDGGRELMAATRHPTVLHFTCPYKPWNTFAMPGVGKWLAAHAVLMEKLGLQDAVTRKHSRWLRRLPLLFLRGFRYFVCYVFFPNRRWWYLIKIREVDNALIRQYGD